MSSVQCMYLSYDILVFPDCFREEQTEKIARKLVEEMQRLNNLVDLERRVRDETTKSLMKMFEDLSAKMAHDVEVSNICSVVIRSDIIIIIIIIIIIRLQSHVIVCVFKMVSDWAAGTTRKRISRGWNASCD